jgi:hypothetical protein
MEFERAHYNTKKNKDNKESNFNNDFSSFSAKQTQLKAT